ncbi:DUF4352 domain-containing protein [Pisciglobus halotolerans]|uniref:DUF4352 domain-containing protein n=1 Tax=Pisciglobus halotolerans TaxID=745365 RepID=A0A1I3EAD8_9LACT|nr:DUF4352 domain-containing protein [Pisciglobus halotolerans]SFH95915.1 protein of unknown function [Pisciglobus halotolerans]
MKQFKWGMTVSFCALLLGACSSGEGDADVPSEETSAVVASESAASATVESEILDSSQAEQGKTEETEIGTVENLQVKELDQSQTSGPINMTITAIKKSQVQPNEDYKENLGGDDMGFITISVKVENTSDKTITFNPEEGNIKTNTDEEVKANTSLGSSLGGEFTGKDTKEGDLVFTFEGDADAVKTVEYTIPAPHDADYKAAGEDLTFDLSFE